uniref:Uncharacterized protein n=1 Tax=Oryza punctata TaxID=4537 RepID=A0A0E0LP81_ORYPU
MGWAPAERRDCARRRMDSARTISLHPATVRRGATAILIYEVEPLLLFFILFTLLGAIGALGDCGSFIDDQPATSVDKAIIIGKDALIQLNIETSILISEIESLVLFNMPATIATLVTGRHSPPSSPAARLPHSTYRREREAMVAIAAATVVATAVEPIISKSAPELVPLVGPNPRGALPLS